MTRCPTNDRAPQALDPPVRPLERGRRVVVDLVRVRRVIAPEPARLGPGPVVEVCLGLGGVAVGICAVQVQQDVVQGGRQVAGRRRAVVRLDEVPAEEGQDERRIAGAQEAPRGVALAEVIDEVRSIGRHSRRRH